MSATARTPHSLNTPTLVTNCVSWSTMRGSFDCRSTSYTRTPTFHVGAASHPGVETDPTTVSADAGAARMPRHPRMTAAATATNARGGRIIATLTVGDVFAASLPWGHWSGVAAQRRGSCVSPHTDDDMF